MSALRMGATEWLLLLILSVLWGGSFFFVEVALEALSPAWVVFLRVFVAALALWVVVAARRIALPRDLTTWGALAMMGLLNNALPFGLITWGQVHVSGGLAAILNATTPLFTVVLAHLLTRDERMTPLRGVGVAVGLVGVVVLVGPGAMQAMGAHVLAQAAILAAAASYALAGLWGRRLRQLPSTVAAAGMLTSSSVIMAPVVVARGVPDGMPPVAVSAAVMGLALLSTSLAYLIYFRILARAGATNLLLVTFLIPVSAIALGVLVLDESLSTGALLGMAIIFAGLACVDGRLFGVLARGGLRR